MFVTANLDDSLSACYDIYGFYCKFYVKQISIQALAANNPHTYGGDTILFC